MNEYILQTDRQERTSMMPIILCPILTEHNDVDSIYNLILILNNEKQNQIIASVNRLLF